MELVLMNADRLRQIIYDNYVVCLNACYPESRHCETCSVQKRIDEACRDLDILEYSGMKSGEPDSDKPNTAAASNDPLHIKEEIMSELTNVQSADLNESAEQTVERVSVIIETESSTAEQPAEPSSAEQLQPTAEQSAAQTQPTTYYDRFSGKEVDLTNISKKAKRKLIFQSVLWFIVGTGGLVWMIVSIIKLLA